VVRKADAPSGGADWLSFDGIEEPEAKPRPEAKLDGAPADWFERPRPVKRPPATPLTPLTVDSYQAGGSSSCAIPRSGGG
jgi:hypothetical protein